MYDRPGTTMARTGAPARLPPSEAGIVPRRPTPPDPKRDQHSAGMTSAVPPARAVTTRRSLLWVPGGIRTRGSSRPAPVGRAGAPRRGPDAAGRARAPDRSPACRPDAAETATLMALAAQGWRAGVPPSTATAGAESESAGVRRRRLAPIGRRSDAPAIAAATPGRRLCRLLRRQEPAGGRRIAGVPVNQHPAGLRLPRRR